MDRSLQTFDFEGSRLRTITDGDGEPWFVAADVCGVLGLGNPTQALARLDEDEKSSIRATLINDEGRPGQGAQTFTIVNEPGLYRLVLGSRKPEARRFKRWITHEVLPTIRKTGAYVSDAAAASDPILTQAQMLIDLRLQQIAQEQRLAAIERRVEPLPAPTTHLSVLAFANLNGIRLDHRLASVLGKHFAAQTRLHGGVIGAVADDHYGTVGNYPLPVLRQVFAAAGLIPDEHLN